MKNKFIIIIGLILFSSCGGTKTISKTVNANGSKNQIVSNSNIFGKKDLVKLKEEWQYEMLIEEGEAPVLDKYKEITRNKLLAKKGAVLSAQRKLAEKIGTIRLNSTTTMKDFSTIDIIQSRLSVFLKGVEIIEEVYDEKNQLYKVTVQMPKLKVVNVLEEYLD